MLSINSTGRGQAQGEDSGRLTQASAHASQAGVGTEQVQSMGFRDRKAQVAG